MQQRREWQDGDWDRGRRSRQDEPARRESWTDEPWRGSRGSYRDEDSESEAWGHGSGRDASRGDSGRYEPRSYEGYRGQSSRSMPWRFEYDSARVREWDELGHEGYPGPQYGRRSGRGAFGGDAGGSYGSRESWEPRFAGEGSFRGQGYRPEREWSGSEWGGRPSWSGQGGRTGYAGYQEDGGRYGGSRQWGSEGRPWGSEGAPWGSEAGRGSTSHVGRSPKNYRRSDERIREDVCDRLTASDIECDDVEVQVKDGEVILTGTASSGDDKREIERVAERVAGAKDVTNQIRVKRESRQSDGQKRTASAQPSYEAKGSESKASTTKHG